MCRIGGAVSIAESDIDSMLLREFAQASFNNRRADVQRLSTRALDKVMAEYQLLGFAGFTVSMGDDGMLVIEGTPARELPRVRT